jgi:two-component system cell cycle response regulator
MSSQIISHPLSPSLMPGLASPAVEYASNMSVPLRMVMAEDDASTRHLMRHFLKQWGFDPCIASDGTEAWNLLQSEDVPTIAIVDWVMPGMEGIELCRKIRRLTRQHYTYILLLTSKNETHHLIEGLQAGADDYVYKPFNPNELRARVLVAERIMRFQEQLIAAREALKIQATHDFLTQLLNRAGIMDVLDQELNRSQRTGEPFSVILADIDHFKLINDTYGHSTGDLVLREVAGRIRTCLRSYDSVGRYGGEEFLIIVPGCDESRAFEVAEKIRTAVCGTPVQMAGADRTITISLGVSENQLGSTSAMLDAADTSLYKAKNSGRNCTKLASLSHM